MWGAVRSVVSRWTELSVSSILGLCVLILQLLSEVISMSGDLMSRFYGAKDSSGRRGVDDTSEADDRLISTQRQHLSNVTAALEAEIPFIYEIRILQRKGRDLCLVFKRYSLDPPEILFVYGPDVWTALIKANRLIAGDAWRLDKKHIKWMYENGKIPSDVYDEWMS